LQDDHETIIFTLVSKSVRVNISDPKEERLNLKKTDWELFKDTLKAKSGQIMGPIWELEEFNVESSEEFLEQQACILRDVINEALRESTPVLKICPQSKRWWNPEIKALKASYNQSVRQWKRHGRQEADRIEVKRLHSQCRRAILSARNLMWRDYLDNARGPEIFNTIRYFKPRTDIQTPDLITSDGRKACSFTEKGQLFLETMFPEPPPFVAPQPRGPVYQHLWAQIKVDEIKVAINSSNPRKAPGPDGLTFAVIQKAYEIIPDHFQFVYQMLLNNGYHPRVWREATCVMIPKPHKPDYSIAKAYRPISLLNCLGKVAEKIMATRMAYIAEKHALLDSLQMGGCVQRSAIDAALLMLHEVQRAKRHREVPSALFIDVKGAFDHVSRERLLHTLTEMQFPVQVISWVNHFLSLRSIAFAFDGQRGDMQKVNTGIPQGSPLSPLLFLLYLSPLFKRLHERHRFAFCPSYVDDVAIMVSGKSEYNNVEELTRAMKTAVEWGEENAVVFDDSKSELIHFSASSKDPTAPLMTPSGTQLVPANEVRWLGVYFDRKLTFRGHWQRRVTAATRALMSIRR